MLARLQKLLVLALLIGSIGWALLLASHGYIVGGAAVAALILAGYALFLAAEFTALYIMQAPGPVEPARAGDLLRAWWGEAVTAPAVFLWRQPFRSNVHPDHLPLGAQGRHGVVLVHGFVCNRGLWNPWMRELQARGVPYIAVNLEPVFGSIDDYPRAIESAVAQIEAVTGESVVLVGHSMGGLAIRAWLRRFDADSRTHRVITIGSPHQGTWLARFGHTKNGKQMRQRSPWLTQLREDEPLARARLFTCFYGHCDNIVFPADSATLEGALNVHVPGKAHVHMTFHPTVFNEVWRWLSPPTSRTPPLRAATAQ